MTIVFTDSTRESSGGGRDGWQSWLSA